MNTNVYIRPGFWVRSGDPVKGALDFRGTLRDVLSSINVPFSDSCCQPDPNTQPVRFNAGDGQLEHFDGNTWTATTQPAPVSPDILSTINSKAQFQSAPDAADSDGSPGEIAFDINYFYICVAANNWKRIPLTTW